MDILPNSEQQQIIDSVSAFLKDEFPLERLREGGAGVDCSPARWLAAAELGLFGLAADETVGGAGYSQAEELLLHREAGRVLFSPALIAQTLTVHLLSAAGHSPAQLISGVERAALLAPMGDACIGTTLEGDFQLLDGDQAQWAVTWGPHGAALVEIGQLTGQPVGCLDETVRMQRVSVAGLATRCYLPGPGTWRRAQLMLVGQLVGIADAARDMACEYAKLREQFGQPIGAFQAIKHRCADLAVRGEAAWFQSVFAALALVAEQADADRQLAAALLLATEAANENAAANIQIHGGMGYTAECSAHLLVKRARVLERLAGSRGLLRETVLGAAGEGQRIAERQA